MTSRMRAFLEETFSAEYLGDLAFKTGFIKRERKITPLSFLAVMMNWNGNAISYASMASALSAEAGIHMSPQAVSDKAAMGVTFIRTIASGLMFKALQQSNHQSPIEIEGVNNIYIADSSIQHLDGRLAEDYEGTNQDASLKLHALYNVSLQHFADLSISQGKESDHTAKQTHLEHLQPGDLIIRDLGYFDLSDLDAIDHSGAYFLSRIPMALKHFHHLDDQPFDVWRFLASTKRFFHEFDLYLGKDQQLLGRVVAQRLPRHKWQQRFDAVRNELGRALTKAEKAKAKWNIYVTNLTAHQLPAAVIQALYEVRWQIELIFKAIKSHAGFRQVKRATTEDALLTFIWARLCYALVMMQMRQMIQASLDKPIGILCWFQRIAVHLTDLRRLFLKERWLTMARYLMAVAENYCRQEKRRRCTTFEKLNHSLGLYNKTMRPSMP